MEESISGTQGVGKKRKKRGERGLGPLYLWLWPLQSLVNRRWAMHPMKRDPATRNPIMMAAMIPALRGRCVMGSSLSFSEGYEREREVCEMSWKDLPNPLTPASVTVHRALMCSFLSPTQSFLLLFRAEHPTVQLILLHIKLNTPGWNSSAHPTSKISAFLRFPTIFRTSKTYLLTHSPTTLHLPAFSHLS